MEWIILWSIVIAAAVIIEVESFSLVSSWFAGGGVVALLLAALGVGWEWQTISFVIVSLGLLVGARPFLKKFIKSATIPTNADINLGRKFKLLADVKGGRSTISINDVVWTVQVDCDCTAGESVILRSISGNKYIAECAKPAEKAETGDKIEAVGKVEEPIKTGKTTAPKGTARKAAPVTKEPAKKDPETAQKPVEAKKASVTKKKTEDKK